MYYINVFKNLGIPKKIESFKYYNNQHYNSDEI